MSKFNFLKKMGIFSALALTLAGCGNYDPAENIPEAIYGPPEMFENAEEITPEVLPTRPVKPAKPTGEVEEETEDEEVEFDVVDNIQPCIYGPPEMFEKIDNNE